MHGRYIKFSFKDIFYCLNTANSDHMQYASYTGLDLDDGGMKIGGKNINSLRYTNSITLHTENS